MVNHLNKQKEIVVQDIKNNLYLISNSGKILWKKQLEGPVLGTIEQIDIFKNGRLQLLFATPHKVYLIDRNGKDVAPFPGNFNDVITQPLSVFDYDKDKNYRLLVTQGKNILMYDKNLKEVKGVITSYSIHYTKLYDLRRGLPGYLILFAPHAFASQRQSPSRRPPSPLVFLPVSTRNNFV